MKYEIKKCGRVGQITPIPQEPLSSILEKSMMYTRQGAQFMPNPAWAIVRMYKVKTGRFPWGMLQNVKNVFNTFTQDSYTLNYIPNPGLDPNKITALSTKLRDYQKDAILQLILNGGGILSLPTGAGKTFTAIEYIKYMNKKTLVIVHTLDLKKQWESQIPQNVTVMTYQSIKDKNILVGYQLLVFDECHHVSAKTIYDIAIKGGFSIMVGLSATPYREDGEDMRIKAALGEIVYTIDRKALIDRGILSDATVYYISYNEHTNDRFLTYPDIYRDYVVNNDQRNQKIVDILLANSNRKILVLVSQVEHGTIIANELTVKGINYKYLYGMIKDRSLALTDDIVIATGIYDEGVDLPDFDLLILAAGGKSSIKLTQRIGRILRGKLGKHAIVYDFVDLSRYLKKHYKRRREILEKDFKVIDQ